jgi:hypothetical protein
MTRGDAHVTAVHVVVVGSIVGQIAVDDIIS